MRLRSIRMCRQKTSENCIAVAKSKKSLLSYGSSGTGAISHLAAELFKSMTGTDLVHVPYKGTAPAVTDVIAGQIDMMFADYAAVAPHAKAGKLRLLAVAGGKRSAAAPELPTLGEAGVKGYAVDAWFGLVAPAGVPKDIVTKINAATVNALKSADVKQRFSELGYEADRRHARAVRRDDQQRHRQIRARDQEGGHQSGVGQRVSCRLRARAAVVDDESGKRRDCAVRALLVREPAYRRRAAFARQFHRHVTALAVAVAYMRVFARALPRSASRWDPAT